MTPEDARALFPGVGRGVYLDTANFGLLATPVAERVSDLLRELTQIPPQGASARYLGLEAFGERARREVAPLVGASPDEMALVESTSHGLQIAAAAIPLARGDEILTAAWDFPGVGLAWRPRVESKDANLRAVALEEAADPTEALIDALRPETRVVCTSSVSEAHGIRLWLSDLAAACRRNGAWLVLDVMQEAGVRALELDASGVDIAAAGGHKWLGCPFGVGFLYVRREKKAELRAPWLGYLSLEEPAGGWDNFLGSPEAPPITALSPQRGARRLEVGGTPNFPGRLALAESCALLNRVGIQEVEKHVLELTAELAGKLIETGAELVTPREEISRAGIVCFTLGDAEKERQVVSALATRAVHVSRRYSRGKGGIRASVHFYNNRADLERFVETLRATMG
jgi:selenocysteine lyase/cysteine desulfurase